MAPSRSVPAESAGLLLYPDHRDVRGISNIAFFVVFNAISFSQLPTLSPQRLKMLEHGLLQKPTTVPALLVTSTAHNLLSFLV